MIEVLVLALAALLLGVAVGFRNDLPGWAMVIFFLASLAALVALVRSFAGQLWIPRPGGGWRVASTRSGWSFTMEPVPKGVRVAAFLPAERPWPAVWVVEAG